MTDAENLTRYVRLQDQEAFNALVKRHAGMLYGVALRRSGDAEIAEEVAQLVFVQLARKAPHLRNPEHVVGWLYRAALLETAHLCRKRRHELTARQKLAAQVHLEQLDPDQQRTELAACVDEALQALPSRDRDLLLAKYYEGLTYAEIAKKHDRGEATTRQQGHRALRKLERLLKRQGLVVPAALLGTLLRPSLSEAAPAGLVEVIEGRVDALGESSVSAWMASAATCLASPVIFVVVAAVATWLPVSHGWGRRIAANQSVAAEEPMASLLTSSRGTGVAEGRLPTVEEILAATGTQQLHLLVQWLPAADAGSLRLLGNGIQRLLPRYLHHSSRDLIFSLVFQRWLAIEPDAALQFASSLRWAGNRVLRDPDLYAWWAQSDPDAAWEAARDHSNELVGRVLERLQEQDPLKALSLTQALPTEEAGIATDWKTLFERLGEADIERALKEAAALPSIFAREEAFHGALASFAKQDPERCLHLAAEHLGEAARWEVSEIALAKWLQSDPPAAWEAIEATESAAARLRFTREAGRQWAALDPDGVSVWVSSIADDTTRRSALTGIALTFAKTDVDRAIDTFEKLGWDLADHQPNWLEVAGGATGMGDSTTESLEKAAHTVALTLADRSFEEALMFMSRFGNKPTQHNTSHEIIRQWLQKDPEGMEEYIRSSPDSPWQSRLASRYADQMSDPKEAIDWAKSLEGEAQEFAVHNAFHKAFEKDKASAIGLLPELNGLPAPARLRALRSMRSHRMTLPQVESMLAWLKAQPDHETDLAEGYEGVANRMAYADLDHAVALVNEMDAGTARQAAVSGMLGYMCLAQPPAIGYDASGV